MCWTLSDGTRIELGGHVFGAGETARKARALLESPPVFVCVGPMPDGSVELDTGNVFLMDCFARGLAIWLNLEVETDYVSRLKDAPTDVQELVRALEAEPCNPTTVY